MKKYNVIYEVTISHDDDSKTKTISGSRIYEAKSSDEAEEKATDDWENGLESDFIDGNYLLDDDIVDVSLDILETKLFQEKPAKSSIKAKKKK